MKYGSVCSGIEAASAAWHPLGWKASFFSEIDKFPRTVLQHHYPSVPLHGDFTTIQAGMYDPIDVLIGGTPCQDFSIAGLRAGIAGERGNLTLEFVRLVERLRPRWLVWENVPGVLSVDGGRAFGAFIGGLGELGYGSAWRTLDAQYFNLAQRRQRVFVVGCLGDWRRAAAVLFERESLSGNPAPRRKTGQKPAGTLSARTEGGGFPGTDESLDGYVVPVASAQVSPSLRAQAQASHRADSEVYVAQAYGGNNSSGPIDVATAVNAHGGPHGRLDFESETFIAHSLRAEGFDASEDGTGRGTPLVPVAFRTAGDGAVYTEGNVTAPLTTQTDPSSQVIAFNITPSNSNKDFNARQSDRAQALNSCSGNGVSARGGDVVVQGAVPLQEIGKRTGASTTDVRAGIGIGADGDPMFTLQASAQHGIAHQAAVRRLTPRECERLMGFRDDYTLVPVRGKLAADGPRYKALGNSFAVPVVRWIGERIQLIDGLK